MANFFSYGRNSCACLVLIVGVFIALFYNSKYFSEEKELCYSFLSQWMDPIAGTQRNLLLSLYSKDKSIEMYDLQAKKVFLKRVHIQGIDEKDFYVGNTVVILSRQLNIIDYADKFTQQEISKQRQKTFAMIKPDAIHKMGEIIDLAQRNGLEVTQLKMSHLTSQQASYFYEEHSGRPFFKDLISYITRGPVLAMELVGSDAVSNWREILGPTDSEDARMQAPESLRATFGTDKQKNAAHGSDSSSSSSRELELFFPSQNIAEEISIPPVTPKNRNSTLCIIKPHALKSGNLGKILSSIAIAGFKVTTLQMFRLEKIQAEEFLEVYKEVLPEYPRMVQQLISGPLVALEVSTDEGEATHEDFRKFVGPMDPEVARELRPSSLRAKFGEDKIKNGLHCTDLLEDAQLEIDYFFNLLQIK